MKNITVTVDEELYHRARVRAAERRTTVSALVRAYLERLVDEEARFDSLLREQNELLARVRREHPGFSAEDRLTRDEAHERDALR